MSLVQTEFSDTIATITLDQPAKRNALSTSLIDKLIEALKTCAAENARVVILRARPGAQVWSAGHDVSELPKGGRDPLGWDDPLRHLIRSVEELPAPVIALVEGGVWGGACELVLACDLIVATPTATFAVTPARLGVPYNVSGMQTFMNACSLRIVKEMVFTAKPISAERAERLGMVNHVVSASEIENFVNALAGDISKNAPLSISVMKEQMRMLAGANPMSPRRFERVQGLRRIVYDSADYAEGIRAFLEKRNPNFRGR